MSALPVWTTALPDWEERIVNKKSLIPCPPLFPEMAELSLSVFHSLRIVDAPNKPLIRDSTRDWIDGFVSSIFGSYEAETGIRHITEYFMLISKKNSKSTLAAGIMLTALIQNWRDDAEFIILSPTKEVADNSFKAAAAMVREDEELSELFLVQNHLRQITHRGNNAVLKVVAADAGTVGGKKAVGVLFDELWLFGKMANAEDMMREAIGGLASRPEGFVIYLTTQSNEPPAGVFKTKLDYARKVRDGVIEDKAFLPLIYEFPMAMLQAEEHLKVENFYITNPNMGLSVNESFLLREYAKAQEEGEEQVRGFLAKHLNVEIGLNLRADRWPGADFWDYGNALEPTFTLEALLDQCEVVTVGIDGGGLDDLLGLAVLGRTKEDRGWFSQEYIDHDTGKVVPAQRMYGRRWLLWTYAWAHPSVLTRRKEIAPRLKDFARDNYMSLVPNIGRDTEELAQIVAKVNNRGLLNNIGLDPNALGGILDALLQVGVDAEKMVSVNQGYRLGGAIKTTERKLAEGVLIHAGTPLMNWCVGNAKVKPVGNAIVITKQMSGTAKIDPLMATFNAASLMALNPESQLGYGDFSSMVMG